VGVLGQSELCQTLAEYDLDLDLDLDSFRIHDALLHTADAVLAAAATSYHHHLYYTLKAE